MGAGVLLIVAVIAVGVWWVDVKIHPIRRCPSCGGSKRNSSNPARWGTCRRCSGKGEVRRFGSQGSREE
jgi:DnaJ-class molecular chaperone